MKYIIPAILILTLSFCSKAPEVEQIVFKQGQDGYACFRIPAIITANNGTLLAFAEGRKNGCSDTGDIDLVLRKSKDKGKTWEPLQVIWDGGENVCGNPAPVVDKKTGTIWLLSTWNLGTDHESRIIDQTSEDTRRVFVLHSNDNGNTWSGAKEITETTKKENWTWYATGPVHGIQLEEGENRGRLVIPCDHIEAGTRHYYSHIIYSDDHGLTWNLGGSTPQHQVNECTVVELDDGQLMLNMRNYDRDIRTRRISISSDSGESWSEIFPDNGLPEPICQASLIKSKVKRRGESIYLFSNPADENKRENMTLKISRDQAATWTDSITLHKGPSAYSDITIIRKGLIGCLFEAGENSPYETITFNSVNIGELGN